MVVFLQEFLFYNKILFRISPDYYGSLSNIPNFFFRLCPIKPLSAILRVCMKQFLGMLWINRYNIIIISHHECHYMVLSYEVIRLIHLIIMVILPGPTMITWASSSTEFTTKKLSLRPRLSVQIEILQEETLLTLGLQELLLKYWWG